MAQPTSPAFRRKQVATTNLVTTRADTGMESTSPPPPPYSLLAEPSQATRPEMRLHATADPSYDFGGRGDFAPHDWQRPVSRNQHGYHDAPQSNDMRSFATTPAWNSSTATYDHHDGGFSQTAEWDRPDSRKQDVMQQTRVRPKVYQAWNPGNPHHPHERDERNDPNHWQRPVSRNQNPPQQPYYPSPESSWNPNDQLNHYHQRETFKDPTHWEQPVSRGDQHEAAPRFAASPQPNHNPTSHPPPSPQTLLPPRLNRLRVVTSLPNLSSSHSPLTPSSAATLPNCPSLSKPALPPRPILPPTTTPFSETNNNNNNNNNNNSNNNNNNNNKSFWTTALTETRHLASGLIPHATESTKHHTILRHSPALVFYRGPSTSVALTLLSTSAHPLPADRSLWLQQRGFSGDSGMKLKAVLGATATWLEVTPSRQIAHTAELDSAVERGWARDIERVLKRDARLVARETHVVRIPEASADGYFRVVLCSGGGAGKGRKVLCPSPVFRVASTSADASVFRGASLATMPLEVGVKVASVFASTVVNRYAGPVVGVVQDRVQRVKPGFVATEAGRRGLGRWGRGGGRLAGGMDGYEEGEGGFGDGGRGLEVVGADEGPAKPFPVKFQGRVVKGTGRGAAELGLPTANLVNVAEDVKQSLGGVYFGWSCVLPQRGFEHISAAWHEAIISVGPSPYAKPAVVPETAVTVHLFHDFGLETFFDARVKVIIMGFLRPGQPPGAMVSQQERLDTVSRDVIVAYSSLSRENWGPEVTVSRLKTSKSARSLAERYGGARDRMQQQVESFPVHLVGIRTASGEVRDQVHGNGGYWVTR